MKKTLSIIMALAMVLSVCFFSVSAAEATVGSVAADYKPAEGAIAITDAAGFAAMAADGNYYLANDITLDATWNAGAAVSATYKENAAFTGTFDGNGKTITTSAPLFANLQGTVKNLTVVGAIDAATLNCGVVAMWTNGTITVENVYNKATIVNGNTTGGILGYGATGTVATFTNCRNDADLSAEGQIGGITGYIQDDSAVITNCVNYGNLTTGNYGAGIIGRFGRDKASAPDSIVTITGCANYGKVDSTKGQTGGILGYLVGKAVITDCVNYGEIVNKTLTSGGIFGATGKTADTCAIVIDGCVNYGKIVAPGIAGGIGGRVGRAATLATEKYYISNCANYGEIEVIAPQDFADVIYVGGIAGYVYGGQINGVSNCVNAGNITVDSTVGAHKYDYYVAGILGYVNSSTFECKNNINAGNIATKGEFNAVCLTVYNKNVEAAATLNNYSVAIDGIAVAYTGDAAAEPSTFVEATAFATAVTADQMASGEVAYLINEAAGATIYYQAIGTDKAPVLAAAEDGSNAVEKKADGTYGNPVKEPETTKPEETKPADPVPTGDSALIFAVVAVISILGVAVVAKRREN